MILAKVTGTVVASAKHATYEGRKILSVVALDESLRETKDEFLAVDNAQAGVGDTVLILREGNGVRQILGYTGRQLPLLELIVGIVDHVEVRS